jgi:uncharacterized membrane protein YtjA (UPF0391 family)
MEARGRPVKAVGRTAIHPSSPGRDLDAGRVGLRRSGATERSCPMLHYALVFLVIALIAAFLGFSGLAGLAATIAKVLFVVFLVLAVVAFLRKKA